MSAQSCTPFRRRPKLSRKRKKKQRDERPELHPVRVNAEASQTTATGCAPFGRTPRLSCFKRVARAARLVLTLDRVKRPLAGVSSVLLLFCHATVTTRRRQFGFIFARLQPHGELASELHVLTFVTLPRTPGGSDIVILRLALIATSVSVWVDVLAGADPLGELRLGLVVLAAWALP